MLTVMYLHDGCTPLQLLEGKHILAAGPVKWYSGSQTKDTDSPIQYLEQCLSPFDGEPGSPQLVRTEI